MAVILSDMPDDVLDNFRQEKVINVAFVRQLTPNNQVVAIYLALCIHLLCAYLDLYFYGPTVVG